MMINQVHLGNCLELFQKISDSSVDLVFADPPFNLGKKYNSTKDNLLTSDYLAWCKLWLTESVRVLKPTGSIFIHNIPKWLTHYVIFLNEHVEFKHWISWDALTYPMGKSLQPAHYGILYYTKDPKEATFYELRCPHKRCSNCNEHVKQYGGKAWKLHPFGPLVSDVWTDITRTRHRRDDHPCQLPIQLLERIILMASDEGHVVLDPFSGTGTTAIAAKTLGRRFIGFEVDPNYHKISNERIAIKSPNSKIGDTWVGFNGNKLVTIRDIDWPVLADDFRVQKQIMFNNQLKTTAQAVEQKSFL